MAPSFPHPHDTPKKENKPQQQHNHRNHRNPFILINIHSLRLPRHHTFYFIFLRAPDLEKNERPPPHVRMMKKNAIRW